jgi:uncharacterized membrane protein YuzA (DUF378 family)
MYCGLYNIIGLSVLYACVSVCTCACKLTNVALDFRLIPYFV